VNAPYDLPLSRATPRDLAAALRQSYGTMLRLVGDFDERQWIGPYLPVVNPPLWETGHVAWFLERWVLRRAGGESFLANADALYDSSRIAHAARWFLPLPPVLETLAYVARVTNAVLQKLDSGSIAEPGELYYVELSLYHQDMHNEAFRYMRQTWGLRDALAQSSAGVSAPSGGAEGDAAIPAGSVTLGAGRDEGFVFDNEKWAHELAVPAFRIARRAVSNGEFLAFVEEGGYGRREFWDDAAWRWREEGGRRAPRYWRLSAQGWEQQVFGRWQPLARDLPAMHVSAWEAQAYCRWADRRLPTEAEWMRAAATAPGEARMRRNPWGDAALDAQRANLDGAGPLPVAACPDGDSGWGCRQMLGNVWEWTSSVCQP
jgi:iron(II)-dependent oxidoreductase